MVVVEATTTIRKETMTTMMGDTTEEATTQREVTIKGAAKDMMINQDSNKTGTKETTMETTSKHLINY